MSWVGYWQLGDTEIINTARTEAYADNAGLNWFRAAYHNEYVDQLVNDDPYVDPITDPAPWYDPRFPESAEFYGIYPLEVTGVDDSTGSASVVERIDKGGVTGLLRKGSRTMVFNGLIIAASSAGADYGQMWLSRALQGAPGAGSAWGGQDLAFFASEPQIGPWGADAPTLGAGDWDGGGA